MALMVGSFGTAVYVGSDQNVDNIQLGSGLGFVALLSFYFINSFAIIFFNIALMRCSKMYFDGEQVSISRGLAFSCSRIRYILFWVAFSSTVGLLFRIVYSRLNAWEKIALYFAGMTWGVATFLVIPVLAYENLTPFDAIKRSAHLLRARWGESIGASFSMGIIFLLFFLLLTVVAYGVSYDVSDRAGIIIFVAGGLFMYIVFNTLYSVFKSALYNDVNGSTNDHFHPAMIDGLFSRRGQ